MVRYFIPILFFCLAIFEVEGAPPKRPTVCLNMIVKDEGPVIERCLASVKKLGIIDYWVIVDTGSTDGTQKSIKKFMKDIPGKLYERPWKNFAHNRNEALALAKDKADYLLFIDADEQLSISDPFAFPSLDKDCYLIDVKTELSICKRVFLIRNNLDWKWNGCLHEDIFTPQAKTGSIIQNAIILATANDGHRSRDPNKFHKDILVLEKALEEEPTNARYCFYLAQTYYSANEFELALKNFEKRAAMGGDEEEIFTSLLMIGEIQQQLKKDAETIIKTYESAFRFRPIRAEPLFRLADYLCKQKHYVQGYCLAKYALTIPYPQEMGFIQDWIYDYGLLCVLSESAYHLGKFDEAEDAMLKVYAKPHLPPDVRKQCEACLQTLKSQRSCTLNAKLVGGE